MHLNGLKALHRKLTTTAFRVDQLGNYAWNVDHETIHRFVDELDLSWCLLVKSDGNHVYLIPRHLNLDDEDHVDFVVMLEVGRAAPVDLDVLTYKLGSKWSYRRALDRELRTLRDKIEACLGERYDDEIERKFNGIRKLIRRTTI